MRRREICLIQAQLNFPRKLVCSPSSLLLYTLWRGQGIDSGALDTQTPSIGSGRRVMIHVQAVLGAGAETATLRMGRKLGRRL